MRNSTNACAASTLVSSPRALPQSLRPIGVHQRLILSLNSRGPSISALSMPPLSENRCACSTKAAAENRASRATPTSVRPRIPQPSQVAHAPSKIRNAGEGSCELRGAHWAGPSPFLDIRRLGAGQATRAWRCNGPPPQPRPGHRLAASAGQTTRRRMSLCMDHGPSDAIARIPIHCFVPRSQIKHSYGLNFSGAQ
jgi:hypothetical protein